MQVVRVLLAVFLAGVSLARAERTHAGYPAFQTRHEAPPKPTSEVARDAGMVGLMHVTQRESLIPILKSWKLLAGSEVARKDRKNVGLGLQTYRFDQVFVSALTEGSEGRSLASSLSSLYSVNNGVESGDFSKVALVFDTKPLDRRDYWANVGWIHRGAFHEGSFLPGQIREFTQAISGEDRTVSNEVMFPRELSLDSLKEIWVHPRYRDEVIEMLREAGVQPRDGRTLEQIVIGRTRMHFGNEGSEPITI